MGKNQKTTGPAHEDFDPRGGFRQEGGGYRHQEGGTGENAREYDPADGGKVVEAPLKPLETENARKTDLESQKRVAEFSQAVRTGLEKRKPAAQDEDFLEAASQAAKSLFTDAAEPMARTLRALRSGPEWARIPEELRNQVEDAYGVALLHREIMSHGPCGIVRFLKGSLTAYTRSIGEISGRSPQAMGGLKEKELRKLNYPDTRSDQEVETALRNLEGIKAYLAFFTLTPEQQGGRTLEGLRRALGDELYARLVEDGRVETAEGVVTITRRKVKWVTQWIPAGTEGEPDGRISFAFDPEFGEEQHAPTGWTMPVAAVDPANAPSQMWQRTEGVREKLAAAGCPELAAAVAGGLEAAKELDWYLSQDAHHPVAVFLPKKISAREAETIALNCERWAETLQDQDEARAFRAMAEKMRRDGPAGEATVQYPQHANAAYLRELGLGDITTLRRYVMAYGDLSLAAYRGKNLAYVLANTSRISEIQRGAGRAAELLEGGDAAGAAKTYADLCGKRAPDAASRRIEDNFTVALRQARDLGRRAGEAMAGEVPAELIQDAWNFARVGIGYRGIQFTAQRPGALKVNAPQAPAGEGAARLTVEIKQGAYGIETSGQLVVLTADGQEHYGRETGAGSWTCDVAADQAACGVRADLSDGLGNRVASSEPEDFVWNFWTMGFLGGTVRLGYGYRDDGNALDAVDSDYEEARANQATAVIAAPVTAKTHKGILTRTYEMAAAATPFLGGWFKKAPKIAQEDTQYAALEWRPAKPKK